MRALNNLSLYKNPRTHRAKTKFGAEACERGPTHSDDRELGQAGEQNRSDSPIHHQGLVGRALETRELRLERRTTFPSFRDWLSM